MKFLVGLLLGIAIAGGIAYYLNQSPNPFVDKGITVSNVGSNPSANPIILAPSTKMKAAVNQNPSNADNSGNNSNDTPTPPNYDFYDVLQGKKDIKPNDLASSKHTPQPQTFTLQLGAFSEADSANNLKARMALLGYTVKIKQTQENDKTIYKVLMGPFDDNDQAQEILDQIKDQNISGIILTNVN